MAAEHSSQRQNTALKAVRAISSSYESTKLLDPASRLSLQALIIDYLDNEITLYDDWQSSKTLNTRINEQQNRLNKIKFQAIDAIADTPARTRDLAGSSIFSSIEKMNDSFGDQVLLIKTHPPLIIMRSLTILVAIVSLISGYSMAIKQRHDWILAFLFSLIMAGGGFVILNLEYPNVGSLHLDNSKTELIELRNTM